MTGNMFEWRFIYRKIRVNNGARIIFFFSKESFYTGSTGTVLVLLSIIKVLAAFNLFFAFIDFDLSLLCTWLALLSLME